MSDIFNIPHVFNIFSGVVGFVGLLFLIGQLSSGVAQLGASFLRQPKSEKPFGYWVTIFIQVLLVVGCAIGAFLPIVSPK